jgi:hypothetical protein
MYIRGSLARFLLTTAFCLGLVLLPTPLQAQVHTLPPNPGTECTTVADCRCSGSASFSCLSGTCYCSSPNPTSGPCTGPCTGACAEQFN